MIFKTIIIAAPLLYIPALLHGMEAETTQLIPEKHYSINNPNKKTCAYTCCPNTYATYSCTERACCAVPSLTPALCCLGMREVASDYVWAQNQTTSFAQAHAQMWCSKDVWFPCCCSTKQEVCTSIVGNCATTTTIASVIYALCVFLPCVTKTGWTFSKKRDALENKK